MNFSFETTCLIQNKPLHHVFRFQGHKLHLRVRSIFTVLRSYSLRKSQNIFILVRALFNTFCQSRCKACFRAPLHTGNNRLSKFVKCNFELIIYETGLICFRFSNSSSFRLNFPDISAIQNCSALSWSFFRICAVSIIPVRMHCKIVLNTFFSCQLKCSY